MASASTNTKTKDSQQLQRLDTTLLKGLRILERLNRSEIPLSVSALANEFELGKSNIHRTLATLIEAGYVTQNSDGSYQPSLKIWEQGMRVIYRNQMRRVALPFMHRLYQETKETVNLVALDGDDSLYLDQIASPIPIRPSSTVGERVPAIFTVSGKVILAFEDDSEKRVRHIFNQYKKNEQGVKLSPLLDEVKAIQDNGYGLAASSWRKGVNSLAGVILGPDQKPLGAIAVAGAKERFTEEKMHTSIATVLNTCTEISVALGAQ